MKKLIMAVTLMGTLLIATAALAQRAPAAAGDAEATHMQEMQRYLQQLQTYLQQMRAQMDAIQRTQDPAERHRLMQEHMKSMQAGMQTIHNMSGGTLEQRVNALETIMDQLLEHQSVLTNTRSDRFKH